MIILSWNAGGVSRRPLLNHFMVLINEHCPGIMVLLETRTQASYTPRVVKKLMHCFHMQEVEHGETRALFSYASSGIWHRVIRRVMGSLEKQYIAVF